MILSTTSLLTALGLLHCPMVNREDIVIILAVKVLMEFFNICHKQKNIARYTVYLSAPILNINICNCYSLVFPGHRVTDFSETIFQTWNVMETNVGHGESRKMIVKSCSFYRTSAY